MATDASGATTSRLVSRGLFSMRWLYDLKPEPREMCTRSDESCRCTPRAKISSADRPRYNACTQRACSLKRNTISCVGSCRVAQAAPALHATRRLLARPAWRRPDAIQLETRQRRQRMHRYTHTHTHTHTRTHARTHPAADRTDECGVDRPHRCHLSHHLSLRSSPPLALVPRDSLSTRHRRSVPRQTCSRSSCD